MISNNKSSGFSLVELLTVVAVIATLVSIVQGSYEFRPCDAANRNSFGNGREFQKAIASSSSEAVDDTAVVYGVADNSIFAMSVGTSPISNNCHRLDVDHNRIIDVNDRNLINNWVGTWGAGAVNVDEAVNQLGWNPSAGQILYLDSDGNGIVELADRDLVQACLTAPGTPACDP